MGNIREKYFTQLFFGNVFHYYYLKIFCIITVLGGNFLWILVFGNVLRNIHVFGFIERSAKFFRSYFSVSKIFLLQQRCLIHHYFLEIFQQLFVRNILHNYFSEMFSIIIIWKCVASLLFENVLGRNFLWIVVFGNVLGNNQVIGLIARSANFFRSYFSVSKIFLVQQRCLIHYYFLEMILELFCEKYFAQLFLGNFLHN